MNFSTFLNILCLLFVCLNYIFKNTLPWDFPGGPVVKNSPFSAGDVGSIPGWGTTTLDVAGQISLYTTTREGGCVSR